MASVAGEVVVQAAVTGHVARDEKLLAGRQVADPAALVVGIAPGPGGELVDEIVARGQELFRCDLARLPEGRRVRDGRVPITERVDRRFDVVHRSWWRGAVRRRVCIRLAARSLAFLRRAAD
ncbi:hypothetical protein CDD83_8034 [Cordyceps sp. RAO-2017]|nr:hypothetical protein CDD83_8034 [Cordyceps sp. RAO-2017]